MEYILFKGMIQNQLIGIFNFEETFSVDDVSRRSKAQVSGFFIPKIIKYHNKCKSIQNIFDGLLSAYDISIKRKKCYWTLFINIVYTMIVDGKHINLLNMEMMIV